MLKLKKITISKSLDKGYLKEKILQEKLNPFLESFGDLVDNIQSNHQQSEEDIKKNIIALLTSSNFPTKKYKMPLDEDKVDLCIKTNDTKEILFETKPVQHPDLVKEENLNKKSMHQMILYYLRERTKGNSDIKKLIITDGLEWFIFDVIEFERLFFKNKNLQKDFNNWSKRCKGNLTDANTKYFYDKIAKPFLSNIDSEIEGVHFKITDFATQVIENDYTDEHKRLYKFFTPENLLKIPYTYDSNSLNEDFYNELLHIIGLQESVRNGKKVIERMSQENREDGALFELTYNTIIAEDLLNAIELDLSYGSEFEEIIFNVSLELCMTWVNRILFLKLLEAQLIKYHNGDKENYGFLRIDKVKEFDILNTIFFDVLALDIEERKDSIPKDFMKIPYLNSSLFETTQLERKTLRISNLRDYVTINFFSSSVLKKKHNDRLSTIDYLLEFLDAYDFNSDGEESVQNQEESKILINASVLGLIFEKINGYKDGSHYTPGYVTMYMCKNALEKVVVDKFNEVLNESFTCLSDIRTNIKLTKPNIIKYNEIVNSIKICDPSVGSGHFLVSALNELISIKSYLGILATEGEPIPKLSVNVSNDELVTTIDDKLIEYKLNYNGNPHPQMQEVQKLLFSVKIAAIRVTFWVA